MFLEKENLFTKETMCGMIFKTILECMVFDDRAPVLFLQLGLLEKLRNLILSCLTTTTTSLQTLQTSSNQKQNIDIQSVCSIICQLFVSLTEDGGNILLTQYNFIHVILRFTKFNFTFFHCLYFEKLVSYFFTFHQILYPSIR